MAVGNEIDQRYVFMVEENFHSMLLRIIHLLRKDSEDLIHSLPELKDKCLPLRSNGC